MIYISFSALVGLLLTKLNHYFKIFTDTKYIFLLFKGTLKIGDTTSLINYPLRGWGVVRNTYVRFRPLRLRTVPIFATAHT